MSKRRKKAEKATLTAARKAAKDALEKRVKEWESEVYLAADVPRRGALLEVIDKVPADILPHVLSSCWLFDERCGKDIREFEGKPESSEEPFRHIVLECPRGNVPDSRPIRPGQVRWCMSGQGEDLHILSGIVVHDWGKEAWMVMPLDNGWPASREEAVWVDERGNHGTFALWGNSTIMEESLRTLAPGREYGQEMADQLWEAWQAVCLRGEDMKPGKYRLLQGSPIMASEDPRVPFWRRHVDRICASWWEIDPVPYDDECETVYDDGDDKIVVPKADLEKAQSELVRSFDDLFK